MSDQRFNLEPWERHWVKITIADPLQRLSRDELRERARKKGIKVHGAWVRKTLIRKIVEVDVEFYRQTDLGR